MRANPLRAAAGSAFCAVVGGGVLAWLLIDEIYWYPALAVGLGGLLIAVLAVRDRLR